MNAEPREVRRDVRQYRKTANTLAGVAPEAGYIDTLEGRMTYEAGDYICGPGAGGEFWPVRKDIFEATYEPVDAARAAVPVEPDRGRSYQGEDWPDSLRQSHDAGRLITEAGRDLLAAIDQYDDFYGAICAVESQAVAWESQQAATARLRASLASPAPASEPECCADKGGPYCRDTTGHHTCYDWPAPASEPDWYAIAMVYREALGNAALDLTENKPAAEVIDGIERAIERVSVGGYEPIGSRPSAPASEPAGCTHRDLAGNPAHVQGCPEAPWNRPSATASGEPRADLVAARCNTVFGDTETGRAGRCTLPYGHEKHRDGRHPDEVYADDLAAKQAALDAALPVASSAPEVDVHVLGVVIHPFTCLRPNVPHYPGNDLYQPCGRAAIAVAAALQPDPATPKEAQP